MMKKQYSRIHRILLIVYSVAIILIAAVVTCIILGGNDSRKTKNDQSTQATQVSTNKSSYTAPPSAIIDTQGNVSCNPAVTYTPNFVITYQDRTSGKQKVISCNNN